MKIILHIGTGKTGSTSIQHSFHHHREKLLEQGILFPSDGDKALDHRALCEALTAPEPNPRAQAMAQKIETLVSRHKPEILILSSEYICYRAGRAPHLHSVLKRYSTDIEVMMYLREPLGYYRSHVQQQLKAQPWLTSPENWRPRYVEMVSAWRKEFGEALSVVPFEKTRLHMGSVVDDLAQRYFPSAFKDKSLEISRSNVSESAEVTALVQAYIAINYPSRERIFRKDVVRLRRGLMNLALKEEIGTKPALRNEVAQIILHSVGKEISILREDHGISFETIDYDALSIDEPTYVNEKSMEKFEDICHIDSKVMERLTHLFFSELLTE